MYLVRLLSTTGYHRPSPQTNRTTACCKVSGGCQKTKIMERKRYKWNIWCRWAISWNTRKIWAVVPNTSNQIKKTCWITDWRMSCTSPDWFLICVYRMIDANFWERCSQPFLDHDSFNKPVSTTIHSLLQHTYCFRLMWGLFDKRRKGHNVCNDESRSVFLTVSLLLRFLSCFISLSLFSLLHSTP